MDPTDHAFRSSNLPLRVSFQGDEEEEQGVKGWYIPQNLSPGSIDAVLYAGSSDDSLQSDSESETEGKKLVRKASRYVLHKVGSFEALPFKRSLSSGLLVQPRFHQEKTKNLKLIQRIAHYSAIANQILDMEGCRAVIVEDKGVYVPSRSYKCRVKRDAKLLDAILKDMGEFLNKHPNPTPDQLPCVRILDFPYQGSLIRGSDNLTAQARVIRALVTNDRSKVEMQREFRLLIRKMLMVQCGYSHQAQFLEKIKTSHPEMKRKEAARQWNRCRDYFSDLCGVVEDVSRRAAIPAGDFSSDRSGNGAESITSLGALDDDFASKEASKKAELMDKSTKGPDTSRSDSAASDLAGIAGRRGKSPSAELLHEYKQSLKPALPGLLADVLAYRSQLPRDDRPDFDRSLASVLVRFPYKAWNEESGRVFFLEPGKKGGFRPFAAEMLEGIIQVYLENAEKETVFREDCSVVFLVTRYVRYQPGYDSWIQFLFSKKLIKELWKTDKAVVKNDVLDEVTDDSKNLLVRAAFELLKEVLKNLHLSCQAEGDSPIPPAVNELFRNIQAAMQQSGLQDEMDPPVAFSLMVLRILNQEFMERFKGKSWIRMSSALNKMGAGLLFEKNESKHYLNSVLNDINLNTLKEQAWKSLLGASSVHSGDRP